MYTLLKISRVLLVVLVGASVFLLFSKTTLAAVTCTGSVDIHSVPTYTQTGFTFHLDNNGDTGIVWLSVSRPSENFSTDADFSSSQEDIEPGQGFDFTGNAISGANEAPAANWNIQVSDDPGGANPVTCTGDFGTAISGTGTDTFAPVLGPVTISDVSDSSATVNWNTDENAMTVLHYSTDQSYTQLSTDPTFTMTHKIVLTGLTANTTYHFYITNTDNVGNANETGDFSFVTANVGQTITVIQTVTETVNTTATPAPSPTPAPDTTPPVITIKTDLSKVYAAAPQITGTAVDNKGVSVVEYSLDDGRNWQKVDETFKQGDLKAPFTFTPPIFDDGNYLVRVRATDINKNVTTTKTATLVIDRLPPQVGGNILSIGSQILTPNKDGRVITLTGLKPQIHLSAVGGPTAITIIAGGTTTSLTKNPETNLWSGDLDLTSLGEYRLSAHSVDGANNTTDRTLNTVLVLPDGRITSKDVAVSEAQMNVYSFDANLLQFSLWSGTQYGQENPQQVDENGNYKLLLPSGTYYIEVTAPHMRPVRSEIFSLQSAELISTNFEMQEANAIHLGPITIPLPDFGISSVKVTSLTVGAANTTDPLVGSEFPYVELPLVNGQTFNSNMLKGRPTLVTVLSNWVPQASSQLTVLQSLSEKESVNFLVVMSQNTLTSVSVFAKRGGYDMQMVADRDGLLVSSLQITSLPTHFFVNRKGIITSTQTGLISREEILDKLVN